MIVNRYKCKWNVRKKNYIKIKCYYNMMIFIKCKSYYKNNRYKFIFFKKRISGKIYSKNLLVLLILENKYFFVVIKVI